MWGLWLFGLTPYFSFIVTNSIVGGRYQRKPLIQYCKKMTCIKWCCIKYSYPYAGSHTFNGEKHWFKPGPQAEQTFRLFFMLTTVISRRKNQWYIVSQLLLEQNIWQAWSLVFLLTKLSVFLKIIFFISLKTTEITSKIQISEVCDL